MGSNMANTNTIDGCLIGFIDENINEILNNRMVNIYISLIGNPSDGNYEWVKTKDSYDALPLHRGLADFLGITLENLAWVIHQVNIKTKSYEAKSHEAKSHANNQKEQKDVFYQMLAAYIIFLALDEPSLTNDRKDKVESYYNKVCGFNEEKKSDVSNLIYDEFIASCESQSNRDNKNKVESFGEEKESDCSDVFEDFSGHLDRLNRKNFNRDYGKTDKNQFIESCKSLFGNSYLPEHAPDDVNVNNESDTEDNDIYRRWQENCFNTNKKAPDSLHNRDNSILLSQMIILGKGYDKKIHAENGFINLIFWIFGWKCDTEMLRSKTDKMMSNLFSKSSSSALT